MSIPAHDKLELGTGDVSVSVLVKDPERLLDLVLGLAALLLLQHQLDELGKVDASAPVRVHLVNHLLSLFWIRVLTCLSSAEMKHVSFITSIGTQLIVLEGDLKTII